MSEHVFHDRQSEMEFQQARRRGFWHRVVHFLEGRPPEPLLSFDQVQDKLHATSQVYRGIAPVEVAKIVGSVGRYRDFDRAFLPLQEHTSDRWKAIAQAYREGRALPPVKLYQIGDAYFVRDGHHRVSVAREQGAVYVDAEVIECRTRIPITPDLTEEELDLKAEYEEFLEATDLDRLRPDQEIALTTSGAYNILLEHIAVHRYFLALERGEAVSWPEAVLSWYDNLYLPIVQIIRQQHILPEFPGRAEGDLYLWVIEHHYFLTEERGQVDFAEAAHDLADQYGQRPLKRALRTVRNLVESVAEGMPLVTDVETGMPAVSLEEEAAEEDEK